MNNNLFRILKKIIADQGENILSDPQRLKAIFSDLAKNEPKEDRVAFGRCIEMGFYNEFKKTSSEDERRRLKIQLANQLQAKTGIDKPYCNDALDLLETVIFNHKQNISLNPFSSKPKSISKRTIFFGIAGALGSGFGEFLSMVVNNQFVNNQYEGTFWGNVTYIAMWAAFLGLGISIGLLAAQSIYFKRKPVLKSLILTSIIGILIGAIAGGIAQAIFQYTQTVSEIVSIISRIACWGIMGCGVGLGVSLFVPNYPKKRSMSAGFLGGFIGGAIYTAIGIESLIGSAAGVLALGFFIGLTISYIEEALREAWLTVIWGKNETKNISLGQKPIIFGSSQEADIYLSNEPSVRASIQIENAKVIMYDKSVNQRRELHNGDRVDLGKISFVVNTKK